MRSTARTIQTIRSLTSASRRSVCSALALAALCLIGVPGCALMALGGAMAQNAEYQKEIEVLPMYDDFNGKRVAVVVNTDMGTMYEYPQLVASVSQGVALRMHTKIEGIEVLSPEVVERWQYNTPQWSTLSFNEIATQLGCDRVIFIDIYEFRLNPPGNSWQWEGAAAANVGIIERDGYGDDMFVDEFQVIANFPTVSNVTRESASAGQIQYGLLAEFIKRTSWLFYRHLEPKHPDKFDARFKTTTDADLPD